MESAESLSSSRDSAEVRKTGLMTYRPPEKQKLIGFKADSEFIAKLTDGVRLWRIHAEERGDEVASIDRSYVMRSLIEEMLDKSFAEYGGRPMTEEAWESIRKAIRSGIQRASKK